MRLRARTHMCAYTSAILFSMFFPVVKATLHRFDRSEISTGALARDGKIRIIDWEPLLGNRSLPSDPSPPHIRVSDSIRLCKDLVDQLVDGNGRFLVAGMKSRRQRNKMRIVLGKRSFEAPEHGILLLYDDLERYYGTLLQRHLLNVPSWQNRRSGQRTLDDFLSNLKCNEGWRVQKLGSPSFYSKTFVHLDFFGTNAFVSNLKIHCQA